MYFPIFNYIMECNEENINEFEKSTGKLIEEKSIMEKQSSPQKVPKSDTKFPFFTFLHYISTPVSNQSQDTSLFSTFSSSPSQSIIFSSPLT